MEKALKYAPVLQRAVELLGSDEKLKFGAAIEQASTELGIPVPEDMVGPLMIAAFQVIGPGRIPGAPDA